MSTVSPELLSPAAPPVPMWYRVGYVIFTALPLLTVHFALCAIPFIEFSWWYLLYVVALTRVMGFGITIGYHRYFSHHSFKTSRVFQFLLAVAGCTAFQKGPLWWVIHHRLHHKHSDTPDDPHSPVVNGFFYGHIGWLFTRNMVRPDRRIVRDLMKYPELVWLERFWMVPGLLVAGACFALGGWGGLVYGYCLSVVFVFQVSFAINSIGHTFGPQRYETGDKSRNNLLLGYLAMGEGWHNNHHRAPYSARHGFAWYELDMTYKFIRTLERLGLVWNVKLPPAEMMTGRAAPEPAKTEVAAEPATATADAGHSQ